MLEISRPTSCKQPKTRLTPQRSQKQITQTYRIVRRDKKDKYIIKESQRSIIDADTYRGIN